MFSVLVDVLCGKMVYLHFHMNCIILLHAAVSTEVVTSADSASNRGGGGIEETVRKARYSIEQSHGLLSLAQCQPPLKQIPEIVFRDGTPWLQLDFSENQINLVRLRKLCVKLPNSVCE